MEEVDATLNSDDEADYMKMDMVSTDFAWYLKDYQSVSRYCAELGVASGGKCAYVVHVK